MLRLVLDTTVWVAGLRSATGASNAILRAVRHGRAKALVSVAMFLEYEAVLKRPEQRIEHGFSLSEIDEFLDAFARFAEPVERHLSWRPQLSDPGDETILEAAVNGRADAIVTYNLKHFAPAVRFGVRVARPGDILRKIER